MRDRYSKLLQVRRNTFAKKITLLAEQSRLEKKTNIRWERKVLNTLPNNQISFNTFKNGDKAIKIDNYRYITPTTFNKLSKIPTREAFQARPSTILFKNPFTRQNVSRKDLKFVILLNSNL
jgi:hypothetical protein